MRCPDCGYLLLDPRAHCPKCEKTLGNKAKAAAPSAPAKKRAPNRRATEDAGSRSYPSLRLNGQGLSSGAQASALALSNDDASDPNVEVAVAESVGETSARLQVVPNTGESKPDASKTEVAGGPTSHLDVSPAAATSLEEEMAALPEQQPQEAATQDLQETSQEMDEEDEISAVHKTAEALARGVADEPLENGDVLSASTVSVPEEETSTPALTEEVLAVDTPGLVEKSVAEESAGDISMDASTSRFLGEVPAVSAEEMLPEEAPTSEEETGGHTELADESPLEGKAQVAMEEVVKEEDPQAVAEEAHEEALFDKLFTAPEVPPRSLQSSTPEEQTSPELEKLTPAAASIASPGDFHLRRHLHVPDLSTTKAAAAYAAQAQSTSLEEEVADVSLDLTEKFSKARAPLTSELVKAYSERLPKQAGPYPQLARTPAPAPGPVTEIGARTGEFPMPAAFRAPAALEDEPLIDDEETLEDLDPNATQVSAARKEVVNLPTPQAPGAQAAALRAEVETPAPGVRPSALQPSQISFPKFSASAVTWPTEEGAGEASAEYPTAEIVGEASSRHSASQIGAAQTLKGKAVGRRLLAFAFDNTLTLLLAAGFIAAAHVLVGMPLPLLEGAAARLSGGPGPWEIALAVIALRLLIDGCYQVGYLAATGRTPGLRLLGLRLKGDGPAELPTLSQALIRWAWSYGLTLGICWGVFGIRKDRWGRALHDRLADSRIVPA